MIVSIDIFFFNSRKSFKSGKRTNPIKSKHFYKMKLFLALTLLLASKRSLASLVDDIASDVTDLRSEEGQTLEENHEHDEVTKKIIGNLYDHPDGVKTINGKIVTDDEFHHHAVKHVGHDYHESLAHIHVEELEGDELKNKLLSQDPEDDLFSNDLEDDLNPTVRISFLKCSAVFDTSFFFFFFFFLPFFFF